MTQKNQVFFEYSGVISYIGKKTKVTDKFWKQEIHVNCDLSSDKFPANLTIPFQAANQKMKLLDDLSVGQDVTVNFKIGANVTESMRGFVNLSVVGINGKYKTDDQQSAGKGKPSGKQQPQYQQPEVDFEPEESDLPF